MDYKVHEAIWIATAIMTYEVFGEIEHFMLDDISFKQAGIKKRAVLYTEKNIDSARISQ
ncbi:hypothetical protein [Lysinibacillus xylanilyticus]|uniref:Uncharacterized protein n=1 Tax=Lysinibacillus xylanilyticus TaxID=582475 RepID=A0ABT4EIW2_9BACI|nr:hypothetical protein [Lysinibacillus xylanilyticus]MCY9545468.1 hypothetical protein [Lysinibacillus xylanilyticus]